MPLTDLLPPQFRNLEWYDNSTLSTIDKCIRKGFWKNLYILPQSQPSGGEKSTEVPLKGISERMGVGAHFGSAIHEALDKFYAPLNSSMPAAKRRLLAMRAFSKKYGDLILDPEMVDKKYSHPRGIDLLDMYFDRYEAEDSNFRVIETEVVGIVIIRPQAGEPDFPPFLYIARSDGLVERIKTGEYFVFEHKTATSPEQKLVELRIGRQTEGYVYVYKQFPSEKKIVGVFANVIAVRAAESAHDKLFYRDYIYKSDYQTDQWRFETIRKVLRWRRNIADSQGSETLIEAMQYFDRNTEECTRYGRCSFYDLCMHGPQNVALETFEPNSWNPLYTDKVAEDV